MDSGFINSFRSYQKTGNFWVDLNPLTKLNICFAFAFTALIMLDYRYGIPLILACCLMAALAGHFKEFFDLFGKISIVIVVFVIIIRQIGMRTGNVTPLFNIFGWQWYLEAFIDSVDRITFLLGFSGSLLLYFTTTPMRDLMYTLEQKGVSHETSFIMLASMQNIIDLKKASVVILESQKSRGIETDGNIIVRAKAFFPMLAPLLLGAIASTEEKAIAMDARAFSVKRKHTFLREIEPASQVETGLVIAAWVFCAATVVYKIYPMIANL
ncbi:MAG: energy-coupling factor transporter transmembrane protein EcfT [Anaerolineaceae bacterium]|nr:energy-coupling factor transporter transmembrane protein EcfT [Anaerolineaceae bacterium]